MPKGKRKGRGFGSVYDKAKSEPGKPPNIWITWTEGGQKQYRGIGQVDVRGKTRAEIRAEEQHLRRLAAKQLAEIALRIANGRAGVETPQEIPLFKDVALEWSKDRRDATKLHPQFGEVKIVRNGDHDHQRMVKYLAPFFGKMHLDQIGPPEIWRFVRARRREGLSGATVERLLALLSRLFNSLPQTLGLTLVNPVELLDKTTRKDLARSEHDPKSTPFLRTKAQIRAVYREFNEPHLQVAFAIGVFAGLRRGEVIALEWKDIDLDRRRIHVERQKTPGQRATGPLKNDESRVAPINDSLATVLRRWKLGKKAKGLVCPAPRTGGILADDTPNQALKRARGRLEEAGVETPRVTWYQATRHTMASHWVMDGGSIEKLCEVLGHSSVLVTQRYAHLPPDCFTDADRALGCVDLSGANVVQLRFGYSADDNVAEDVLSTEPKGAASA
jgi:integrase